MPDGAGDGYRLRGAEARKRVLTPRLEEIQAGIEALAARIGAVDWLGLTFGHSLGDGTPCVEVCGDGTLHWVVSERGTEFERRVTRNRDELYYWVFASVVGHMARSWARDHESSPTPLPAEGARQHHRLDADAIAAIRATGERRNERAFHRAMELLAELDDAWPDRYCEDLRRKFLDAGQPIPAYVGN